MLVEINLLTEKDKRDITYWLIAGLILAFLLSSLLILKIYNDSLQNEISDLEREWTLIVEEISIIQQQIDDKPVSYFQQLEMFVERAENSVIPASELLRELVRLLPEHGYFLSFDFNHPETVVFQVRFDQMSSVAAYTSALNTSALVSEVALFSINTEALEIVNADDEILPRYVAHFELTVDREVFSVKEEE